MYVMNIQIIFINNNICKAFNYLILKRLDLLQIIFNLILKPLIQVIDQKV